MEATVTSGEGSAGGQLREGELVLGKYRVIDRIGAGGNGAVFRVHHEHLGLTFAVKTLNINAATDQSVRLRFQREAETAAALRHPNVVEVFDWDTLPGGIPCMVMEHLQGEDLAARLSRGPLPWEELARIGREVLSGLEAAHRCGVIHRDLKPHNIFLARQSNGEELAKLLDFGIAKAADAASLTVSQSLLGTPSYMSPEQARGEMDRIGPHSDLFSFGALLYEMTCGRKAFGAPNIPAAIAKVCSGDYRPVRELRPQAPKALVSLIDDLLRLDCQKRLNSAERARQRLEAIDFSKEAEGAGRPGPSSGRRWLWAALVSVPVLLGVSAGLHLVASESGTEPRPQMKAPQPDPSAPVPTESRAEAAVTPLPEPDTLPSTSKSATGDPRSAPTVPPARSERPPSAPQRKERSTKRARPRLSTKVSAEKLARLYRRVGALAEGLDAGGAQGAQGLIDAYLELDPTQIFQSASSRKSAHKRLLRLQRDMRRLSR